MWGFLKKLEDLFEGVLIYKSGRGDYNNIEEFSSYSKNKQYFVISFYVFLLVLTSIAILGGLYCFFLGNEKTSYVRVYNSLGIFFTITGSLFTLTVVYCFIYRLKN